MVTPAFKSILEWMIIGISINIWLIVNRIIHEKRMIWQYFKSVDIFGFVVFL